MPYCGPTEMDGPASARDPIAMSAIEDLMKELKQQ
jgi:ABC-type phosphate transport system ATPase subunit